MDRLLTSLPHVLLAQGEQPSGGSWFVPLILVFLIFYFIVIRPGSRERKDREARIASLEKHDKVITNAGIHGTVVAMDDDTVTLRVDEKNNVRLRFSRQAIWQVLTPEDGKGETAKGASSRSGASS